MKRSLIGLLTREPDPEHADALSLLLMVHELHKAGFQRIRIQPGMAPSGMHWRCTIAAAEDFSPAHGARIKQGVRDLARYTSGWGSKYFEWEDSVGDTPRRLAVKFIERFPSIAEKGMGADWEYAGWFVEMLGFAERGAFPVAFADYELEPNCLASDGERRLPPPPLSPHIG